MRPGFKIKVGIGFRLLAGYRFQDVMVWIEVRKRGMDYVSTGPNKVTRTRIDVCVWFILCGSDRGGVASMMFLNELISLVETLDGLTTC